MTKKPRFPPKRRPAAREIVFVVFEDFQILDVAGPLAAFEIAARFAPGAYTMRIAARAAGLVRSSAGVAMPAVALARIKLEAIDTLIVSGGEGTRAAMQDAALVASVKRGAKAARRIASVCSGAFVLAAAGLLTGKRATTHWRTATTLQRLYPDIAVEPDCIYVRDGKVWTSAGITAGIDLALAMIAADCGADIAAETARQMVVYAQRTGGQTQHSTLLALDRGEGRFPALNAWMREHLGEDLSVERLAKQAAMSPRNFARAYTAETGVTPAKAVERLRLEAAREALEEGGAIQEIAARTGFGDSERIRRAFDRVYGAPPASLRRTLRRA